MLPRVPEIVSNGVYENLFHNEGLKEGKLSFSSEVRIVCTLMPGNMGRFAYSLKQIFWRAFSFPLSTSLFSMAISFAVCTSGKYRLFDALDARNGKFQVMRPNGSSSTTLFISERPSNFQTFQNFLEKGDKSEHNVITEDVKKQNDQKFLRAATKVHKSSKEEDPKISNLFKRCMLEIAAPLHESSNSRFFKHFIIIFSVLVGIAIIFSLCYFLFFDHTKFRYIVVEE